MPGVGVADAPRDRGRRRGHPLAQRRRHRERRRLLDHFLMAPLDRALALDERHDGAVVVAEQLDLDVTRARRSAARGRRAVSPNAEPRFGARGADAPSRVVGRLDHAHALAAAAGDRLDHQRIADRAAAFARSPASVAAASNGRSVPGTTGTPAAIAAVARRGLAAHERDRVRRRPDEGQAGVARRRAANVGVLGEEPVARDEPRRRPIARAASTMPSIRR